MARLPNNRAMPARQMHSLPLSNLRSADRGDEHMDSHGKVAIITGAGTGIGKAVALAFLEDGYRVVLAGRRQEPLEQALAQAGSTAAERGLVVPTDVRDPASVGALFARAKSSFGRLDVLFNNAGVSAPGIPLEDLSYDQWKASLDTNLTGPFLCT